jgi:hypothetical protein
MTTTIPQPSRGPGSVWRTTSVGLLAVFGRDVLEPLRGVGGLFLMSVEAVRFLFRPGRPDVGRVTGRAVRAPLIVVVSVTLLVSLAICGTNGNFSSSG